MDFQKIELLEEYRGYEITTRLVPGSGVRIQMKRVGLVDFADSVEDARRKIDELHAGYAWWDEP